MTVNGKLETLLKQAVLPYFKLLSKPFFFLQRQRKTLKACARVDDP
jgi:hypothetical protein